MTETNWLARRLPLTCLRARHCACCPRSRKLRFLPIHSCRRRRRRFRAPASVTTDDRVSPRVSNCLQPWTLRLTCLRATFARRGQVPRVPPRSVGKQSKECVAVRQTLALKLFYQPKQQEVNFSRFVYLASAPANSAPTEC